MSVIRGSFTFLILIMLSAGAVVAQTATISGRVADAQGGVVMNAVVTLTSAGQLERTVRSQPDGMFSFENVRPGQYTVEVQSAGFAKAAQTISVSNDSPTPLQIVLQVQSVSSSVEVVESVGTALTAPSPTGSRLNLTPLEIPASVQIVTGEIIRERGDVSLEEAESRLVGVTNLAAPGNGGGSRMARGFSGVTSVMRLYDGTQLFIGSGTVTFPFDPWTVDRLEVLGGPASVMYGNGAIGGVINIVPRRPNHAAFENNARFTAGSLDTYRAAFDTSGPINSRMAYRFDFSRNQSNGWVDRGRSNSNALSGALDIDLTSKLRLTLSHDWGFQRPMRYFGTPLINGVLDPSIRNVNYNVSDANVYYKDNVSQAKLDFRVARNVTIRSNFNMLRTNRFWHDVETYGYIPATNLVQRTSYLEIWHDQEQYGNRTEAVVTGTIFGKENTFSAGTDYNWVRFQHTNNSPNSNSSFVPLNNPNPGKFIFPPYSTPQFRSYAHHNAEFFEDRFVVNRYLSLVAGARIDNYDIKRRDLRVGGTATRTFTPFNWRAGAVVSPQSNLSLYGQYATATDGVSTLLTLSPEQQLFDLTPGNQVEVGAKRSFMSGHAELTVAAYRIVKRKLLIPNPDNPTIQQQVGQQSSRGLEATFAFMPIPELRIEANASVLRARFDNFREAVNGVLVSRDGRTPPNVPQQTFDVWTSWSFMPGWRAQGGVRVIGSRYLQNANTGTTPAYGVVDATIGRRVTESTWLEVRAGNIFDKLFLQSVTGSNTAPPSRGRIGAPRTIEVTLTARF